MPDEKRTLLRCPREQTAIESVRSTDPPFARHCLYLVVVIARQTSSMSTDVSLSATHLPTSDMLDRGMYVSFIRANRVAVPNSRVFSDTRLAMARSYLQKLIFSPLGPTPQSTPTRWPTNLERRKKSGTQSLSLPRKYILSTFSC